MGLSPSEVRQLLICRSVAPVWTQQHGLRHPLPRRRKRTVRLLPAQARETGNAASHPLRGGVRFHGASRSATVGAGKTQGPELPARFGSTDQRSLRPTRILQTHLSPSQETTRGRRNRTCRLPRLLSPLAPRRAESAAPATSMPGEPSGCPRITPLSRFGRGAGGEGRSQKNSKVILGQPPTRGSCRLSRSGSPAFPVGAGRNRAGATEPRQPGRHATAGRQRRMSSAPLRSRNAPSDLRRFARLAQRLAHAPSQLCNGRVAAMPGTSGGPRRRPWVGAREYRHCRNGVSRRHAQVEPCIVAVCPLHVRGVSPGQVARRTCLVGNAMQETTDQAGLELLPVHP